MSTTADPARYEIKIDLQGLIRLLAKNLYAEPDVFVRELVQNAHDSIQRRAVLDAAAAPPGLIRIRVDRRAGTISVTDNGSGLTEPEIHQYLATIGRSGTGEFRSQLLAKGRQAEVSLIGQFGIGLLSAFVVAHRVEVDTLSREPGSPPLRWVSEGQKDYRLEPGERTQPGTTVTLFITDACRDMLDADRIRRAVRKYADFIPFPIHLGDETVPSNTINAPWHRTYLDEEERLEELWRFVSQRFEDLALEVIPVRIEGPCRVDGVLYITDRRVPAVDSAGLVDLYQNRMFIAAQNRDLLPLWARFVRGVIDSPDLTPTASRDTVQQDGAAERVREALGRVIVDHLRGLAERDPARLERIMTWHAYHVKAMAVTHAEFFEAVADLVPFDTNSGAMTLRQYCEAAKKPGTQGIDLLYFTEPGSATQFHLLCDARGLKVVNASYAFEEAFLKAYADLHPEVRLHLLDLSGSDLLFEPLNTPDAAQFEKLERDFRAFLPDPRSEVRVVKLEPAMVPAVVVLTKEAQLWRELERTRKSAVLPEAVRSIAGRLLNERPAASVVVHLNSASPTIQQLARMATSELVDLELYKAVAVAIYNNALLLAHHLLTPEAAQSIFNSSTDMIARMMEQTRQVHGLRAQVRKLEVAALEAAATGPRGAMGEWTPARASSDHASGEVDPATEGREEGAGSTEGSASRRSASGVITCLVVSARWQGERDGEAEARLEVVRRVLEAAPFYWRVVVDGDVPGRPAPLTEADVGVVDLTSPDPHTFMALGALLRGGGDRPVVVLEPAGGLPQLPLEDAIHIPCPPLEQAGAEAWASSLRAGLAPHMSIHRLNRQRAGRYLSPALLSGQLGLNEGLAEALSRAFGSIEGLMAAGVDELCRRVPGLSRGVARGLVEDLAELS